MNAIKVYFLDVLTHHYVDFKGRATRKQFWLWVLFCVIAVWIIDLLAMICHSENAASVVASLVNLAILLPSLSMGARRLHDSDKSAWWLLLNLLPILGGLVLFVFYLLPSTEGENRFGANN